MLAQSVASVYKKRIVLYSKEKRNNAQRSTYKHTHSPIYAVRTQGHLSAFKREKTTASFCIQSTKPL